MSADIAVHEAVGGAAAVVDEPAAAVGGAGAEKVMIAELLLRRLRMAWVVGLVSMRICPVLFLMTLSISQSYVVRSGS